jgi:glycosyltransferase involved in cell wall biosynthesis
MMTVTSGSEPDLVSSVSRGVATAIVVHRTIADWYGCETPTVRIAIFSHTLPQDEFGGSQEYVVSLAMSLAVQHEVLILSGSRSGPTGLAVRGIPRLPPLASRSSIVRKTAWHLRDQWSLRQHRLIRQELETFRPDVVHSHQCQGLTGSVFSAIAACGVPHVHTAHDLNLLCARITMAPGGLPCRGRCLPCLGQRAVKGGLAARRLDYLVAPSDFVRRIHVEGGVVPASRAITVRQGASPGRSRVRGTTGPLQVGFIGSTSAHKGILTLLTAVARSEGQWQLHVAGAGALADQVAAAASLEPRITYHGHVEGETRDRFYDRLDLLVVPSEYAEAAPLVVVEAAIRALPSIVTNQGGLPETPLSTVVPARSPDDLAAAIDRFEREPELLRAASAALAARQQEFSWDVHLAQVSELLERARTEPGAPSHVIRPARRILRRRRLAPSQRNW